MAKHVLMVNEKTGDVAFFDEAPSIAGKPTDYGLADPRNAPLISPSAHLPLVRFHTQLDNMEVAFDLTHTVAHAAVALKAEVPLTFRTVGAKAVTQNASNALAGGAYAAYKHDTLLLTHNLGYVPLFEVAVGKNAISPGYPVQRLTGSRGRYVTAWATTTQIWLSEYVDTNDTSPVPAVSVTYSILVIRKPPPIPTLRPIVCIDLNEKTAVTTLAGGRWSSDKKYLSVVDTSRFSISRGRTIDLQGGAPRFLLADGTHFDPVGTSSKMRLIDDPTYEYGASMAYSGAAKTGPVVAVQTP